MTKNPVPYTNLPLRGAERHVGGGDTKSYADVDSAVRAKPEKSGEWSWVRIPPSATLKQRQVV